MHTKSIRMRSSDAHIINNIQRSTRTSVYSMNSIESSDSKFSTFAHFMTASWTVIYLKAFTTLTKWYKQPCYQLFEQSKAIDCHSKFALMTSFIIRLIKIPIFGKLLQFLCSPLCWRQFIHSVQKFIESFRSTKLYFFVFFEFICFQNGFKCSIGLTFGRCRIIQSLSSTKTLKYKK